MPGRLCGLRTSYATQSKPHKIVHRGSVTNGSGYVPIKLHMDPEIWTLYNLLQMCFFFPHKQIYKSHNILVSYFLVWEIWLCCIAIFLNVIDGLQMTWMVKDKGHHLEFPFLWGDVSAGCLCLREMPVRNRPKAGQERCWLKREKIEKFITLNGIQTA